MMREFIAGERAFASRPHVQFRKQRDAYDHLARVKEWSIAGADDDASDGDDGGEA
jgi:ATP-dependent helicase/nuclease subunit B